MQTSSAGRRATILAIAAMVFTFGIAERAQAAKFLGLGDLTGGSFSSDAFGVSADGSVVVGGSTSASGLEAFRWTSGGGMVGLGDLAGGSFFSRANGVSADGSVVVGGSSSASGQDAFRWTSGGGLVSLGDLTGGSFSSDADGVSADGSVAVGGSSSASGFEAFRWTSGGGMVGLGDLAGGSFSGRATAVSADGSVVVGYGQSAAGYEAFRWTSGGGLVSLGDLTGGQFSSFADGVSADGSVVVGTGNSASGTEAVRWMSGDGMGLGDLTGGIFFSEAFGVSADGSVIVGGSDAASGNEAFVWDETNGMRRVFDVISPSVGAALNGWTLTRANAISADGRTVVGYGTDPSGNRQAWLAYLPDQVFWLPKTNGAWDAAASWSVPFGIEPGDSVVIEPAGSLTVLGPTTSATVSSLVIGGGSGIATLELQSGGTITSPTVAIDYTGVLTGDGTINGNVLSQGTIRADNVTITGTLINLQDSVVEGNGRVNVSLDNGNGLVRARAGERLQIIGASHSNNGRIEAIGTAGELAEIEFKGTLGNADSTGLITGRNAVMRFNNGLSNKGSLALTGGTNDVFGDIDNMDGSAIVVTGGAAATFYDDVTQDGVLRVSKVGSTTSTAVFLGEFIGDGGSTGGGDIFFEGDLRPGNSPAQVTYENNVFLGSRSTLEIELGGLMPGVEHDKIVVDGSFALDGTLQVSLINSFTPQAGNSFDILDWDNLTGTFDTLALPVLSGSLVWNTDQLYTTGVLAVVAPGLAGDYNQNGTVDAADYVIWRKTGGTQQGYNTWRTNFGRTAGSGATAGPASTAGATGSASAAVPEPRALVLFSIGLASLLIRRCSDSLFRSALTIRLFGEGRFLRCPM
jgi:probable HAF family extracellular repeat protein